MSHAVEPPPAVELPGPSPPAAAPRGAAGPRRPAARPRPWAPVALACALLVGSGALRLWQARRVEAFLQQGRVSPVPLKAVPLELGPWRGRPEELDPQIARRTGQIDHIFRTYVDTRTGVSLDVIVLYGPAVELKEHAPEQCYPAAGFTIAEGPELRQVPTPRGPCRSTPWSSPRARGGRPSGRRSTTPGATAAGGPPCAAPRSSSSGSRPCTRSTWRGGWPPPNGGTSATPARNSSGLMPTLGHLLAGSGQWPVASGRDAVASGQWPLASEDRDHHVARTP
jgi:hypothetical protein